MNGFLHENGVFDFHLEREDAFQLVVGMDLAALDVISKFCEMLNPLRDRLGTRLDNRFK